MAKGSKARSWYHPGNLMDAFDVLTNSSRADVETDNPAAMIGWTLIGGYILGNSLGTANTQAGRTRLHAGPVYIW